MRVPVSWLRTLVPGLTAPAGEIAAALVRVGLEVEQVHRVGHDVEGVVVGGVLDIEELAGFKKPIRYCHVDVGSRTHEVVCGATNFAVGDRIAFATPGALLPGAFRILARRTYGHSSDGMICSAKELGLSEDHEGILVLAPGTLLGADVVELLALRDEVLDIAVTPDRGYQLSVRGVAREAATAYGLEPADPGLLEPVPGPGRGHPVRVEDASGCDRFVARTITGVDVSAVSPAWLQRRLVLAGMRPVSLAVDVTNHVMLELGQPLHAYDRAQLQGGLVVRRAAQGERLTTLDGQDRALDPGDLLIADDRGPIGIAGVMGGASTEVSATTTDLVIEAAHFTPLSIARSARRHRLASEASRRFERGVDTALAPAAAEAAVRLLVELGGAVAGGSTDVDLRAAVDPIAFPLDRPGRVAGRDYAPDVVRRRLADVGCAVEGTGDTVQVHPPTWRPDLRAPIDLVEEVVRLEGYDTVPVLLPTAPAGRGLTTEQRLLRSASRALADAGLVEVAIPPFVSEERLSQLGGAPASPRLLNPLSETDALLRPLLLPGLVTAALRNVARGQADVALFETGLVFHGTGSLVEAPGVDGRPTDEERARLDGALPRQAKHVGVLVTGTRPTGEPGRRRPVDWADAVEALVALGRALRLDLRPVRTAATAWHPGRCAELQLDGRRVGLAGELHPRVVAATGLPPRTVAAEANLSILLAAAAAQPPVPAPRVSPYPAASVDIALVVPEQTPAAEVEAALRHGAGPLLESLQLFDVYSGPQVGAGHRSLAFALRLRAPDRTLADTDVLGARDAAVAEAHRRVGAVLRGA